MSFFPETVDTAIARHLLAVVQDDPLLSAYLQTIRPMDRERIRDAQLPLPALYQVTESADYQVVAHRRLSTHALGLVTASATDDESFERVRALDHLAQLIRRQSGVEIAFGDGSLHLTTTRVTWQQAWGLAANKTVSPLAVQVETYLPSALEPTLENL